MRSVTEAALTFGSKLSLTSHLSILAEDALLVAVCVNSHGAAGPAFQYSAAGLCCLPDRLGADILAVADVVGIEGLSATGLSEIGSAAETSDCASEPHNKWNDASPVPSLTAVTMSSCSRLHKQVQSAEGYWLNSDAKLACTQRTACLAMSTGMSTSSARKHMA